MKKRALSVLLALALCFTMFSGVTSAAKLGTDRVLDSIGGVLDSMDSDAIQRAQKAKLAEIVASSASVADDKYVGEGAEAGDAVWAPIAEALMSDDAFMSTTPTKDGDKNSAPMYTVYPYFMLRYYQANGTDNEVINAAIADMERLDTTINTAGKGLKDALKDFDPYGQELTDIFTGLTTKNADALVEAGIIEPAGDDYVFVKDPKVIEYAQNSIFDSVLRYAKMLAASQSSADVDGAYDAFMNTNEGDIAKKDVANFVGFSFLNKLINGGLRTKFDQYITANGGDIVGKAGAAVPAMFSSDRAVAVEGVRSLVKTIVGDAINGGLADDFIGDLANLGIDSADKAVEDFNLLVDSLNADGLDVDSDGCKELYQTILLDVAFNRSLQLYNADGTAPFEGAVSEDHRCEYSRRLLLQVDRRRRSSREHHVPRLQRQRRNL